MSNKEPCTHPFDEWRNAGVTYDQPGLANGDEGRYNFRTFVWCEACGALGKKRGDQIEWRLPGRGHLRGMEV